jgi:myo-inositol-1(or 4)-monophosphatase
MGEPSSLLNALGELATRAGRMAQEERRRLTLELKPDGSIVTNADRGVELFLREELPKLVPDTGIWGEEFEWDPAGVNGAWAVDPVDGTSNFSYGGLIWGTSVGLMQGGDCVLAAIYLPDIDELYVGERSKGAWLNGRPLPLIPPGKILDQELVSFDDALLKRFPKARVPGKMRCYGAFVADAMFTACQRFRGMVGRREKLYDIAASVAILRELDAEIRYADGDKFDLAGLCAGEKVTKPWLMFPRENGFYL